MALIKATTPCESYYLYKSCIYQRVKMILTLNTAREMEEKNQASVCANTLSAKGPADLWPQLLHLREPLA